MFLHKYKFNTTVIGPLCLHLPPTIARCRIQTKPSISQALLCCGHSCARTCRILIKKYHRAAITCSCKMKANSALKSCQQVKQSVERTLNYSTLKALGRCCRSNTDLCINTKIDSTCILFIYDAMLLTIEL